MTGHPEMTVEQARAGMMTRDVACALLEWSRTSLEFYDEPFKEQGKPRILKRLDDGLVFAHLNASLPAGSLYVHPQFGWCIRQGLYEFEVQRAQAFINHYKDQGDPVVIDFLKDQERKIARANSLRPNIKRGMVAWKICDEDAPRKELRLLDPNDPRAVLLRNLGMRPWRQIPKATPKHIHSIQSLLTSFPNFEGAIERIISHLALQAHTGQALKLPPLLLLGAPGIGKTAFCMRLGQLLGTAFESRSLAEMSSGFVLSGNSNQWRDAQPGIFAKGITRLPDEKTLMVFLDELDKSVGSYQFPVDTALLSVLEPASASTFIDEFVGIEMDVSPISILFAANNLSTIRPEILSRLEVVDIPAPTEAQMPAVIQSVDAGIRSRNPGIGRKFKPLDQELIHGMSRQPPRRLQRLLEAAYAVAAQDALRRKAKGSSQVNRMHLMAAERAIDLSPRLRNSGQSH